MPSDFLVNIEEGKSPKTQVIHMKGEFDEIAIGKLKAYVDPLLEDANISKLIFDLSEVVFLNSKGIGYLVSVHTHLSKDGRGMIITSAKEPVIDVLSLVGLTNIIPYYSNLEEALSA